jgi:hypothetical protein
MKKGHYYKYQQLSKVHKCVEDHSRKQLMLIDLTDNTLFDPADPEGWIECNVDGSVPYRPEPEVGQVWKDDRTGASFTIKELRYYKREYHIHPDVSSGTFRTLASATENCTFIS